MNEWFDPVFIALIASLLFIGLILFQFFINLLMPSKKSSKKNQPPRS